MLFNSHSEYCLCLWDIDRYLWHNNDIVKLDALGDLDYYVEMANVDSEKSLSDQRVTANSLHWTKLVDDCHIK